LILVAVVLCRAKTPGIEKLIYELSPDREDFHQDGDDDD